MSRSKSKRLGSSVSKTKNDSEDLGCIPITPKILIKSLEGLKSVKFMGLYFNPEQVAEYIKENHPCVQQDFTLLLMEVGDKLSCAAKADLIGYRQNVGYFPFNLKQQGARLDSGSELTFWVLYKKLLEEKKKNSGKGFKRRPVIGISGLDQEKKRRKIVCNDSFKNAKRH